MSWLKAVAGGVELSVLVQPRASRTKIVGEHDGRLKIALSAPPVDGEANAALVEFLSDALRVRKAAVALVEGETSRRKRVRVTGVGPDVARLLIPSEPGPR
ncbi:MAG: YggU family protein [Myxococcaceae bacterium]|nr:YggU family protein [Myxococcaceae bacterium]